jgi:lysyl-tRNA synthetase class 1
VRYYDDFVAPTKVFRVPDDVEREALLALDRSLAALEADGVAEPDAIQNAIYEVGRSFERYQDRDKTGPDGRPGVALAWFATLYRLLLGMERGPRFGSFVAIYGIAETRTLIAGALAGTLAG